jgi:hypothetical protein
MRDKNSKTKKQAASKKNAGQSHEFETMSQRQNRYGKGRERNGSDGTSAPARGSNH